MPALIGGFLRRGRVYSDIQMLALKLNIYVSGLIVIALSHVSLNTEETSNEVFFEGCVKWRNAQNIGERLSTLGLILVSILSLMKVNLCIKNGPAILKSSNMIFRFRDRIIVRNTDEAVCFKIASKVNTITEGNLISIHDKNFYQKAINSKRGNLERV